MQNRLTLLVAALLVLAGGCTFRRVPSTVTLRLAGPAFKDFACVAVLVTGEGIPSADRQDDSNAWEKIYAGSPCAYPGISTVAKSIPASGNVTFSIGVPSGKSRTFQVVGIQTTADCPTDTAADLLLQTRRRTLPKAITGMYELGRSARSVFQAATIPIDNTYVETTAENILDCQPKDPIVDPGGGTGGGTFAFKVPAMSLVVGDEHRIETVNGVGSISFTVSGAGGTVTGSPPTFNAALSGVNTVTATDAGTGKTAVAIYDVKDLTGLSTFARFRYTAQAFATYADGATIIAPMPWSNSINASGNLLSTSDVVFRKFDAPNGLPAVEIPVGGRFDVAVTSPIGPEHSLFAVARRLNSTPGRLFSIFGGGASCNASVGACTALEFGPSTSLMGGFYVRSSLVSGNPQLDSGTDGTGWALLAGEFALTGNMARVQLAGNTFLASPTLGSFVITSGNIVLGGDSTAIGTAMPMQIAEILVVDTTADTSTILSFYRAKYGLP